MAVQKDNTEKYMREAIKQAKKAAAIGEVTILFLIERGGTILSCPMCAGAIVQARIPKVVIGAMNPKAGCAGSILDLLQEKRFNHQVDKVIGVLQEQCSQMMQDFFRELRRQKKTQKEQS